MTTHCRIHSQAASKSKTSTRSSAAAFIQAVVKSRSLPPQL